MDVAKPTKDTFAAALRTLKAARIPFLVGGAFAVQHYTGYLHYTKDLDIFLHKRDVDTAMAALTEARFTTRIEAEHWLAKASRDDHLIDLIFGSGNWLGPVDESFFGRSVSGRVLGVPVKLLATEEMIWSKSFVKSRERFDGADIVHLVNASKGKLDWNYLLTRFGDHWQLLLADVLLFNFVFPANRSYVPEWLVEELIARMRQTVSAPLSKEKVCRGTLLDKYSFVFDVESTGYRDPREELAEAHGYSREQVVEDREKAKVTLATVYK